MVRTIREALWIFLIAGILAGGAAFLHPRAPSWFLVEPSGRWDLQIDKIREVLGEDADRVVWIDARPDKAFQKGHLKGAIHLNRERWGDLVAENQDQLQEALGNPVFVYCDGRGCQRSVEIAERLRQLLGLEPVYVLRGDWRKLN
jgi:rhodanese-related sulfurtransferase